MRSKPTLVVDRPKEIADWVCERLPCVRWALRYGFLAIGVERRGKLVAGFVFHTMSDNRGDIELSCSGNGAFMTREVFQCLTHSIFDMLGCAHVTCRTSSKNVRASALLERMGFKLEGIQRLAWDGEADALLYGMIKTDIHEV